MLHRKCKNKEIGSHWEMNGFKKSLNAMNLGCKIRRKLGVVVMRGKGKDDNYNFQQKKIHSSVSTWIILVDTG